MRVAVSAELITSSPDSVFRDHAYDGPLLTQETWRGRVLGSVTHGYDNAFRAKTESVNGSATVSYGYDADGLMNQLAGAWGTMTLTPDPVSGLLAGTSIGTVASTLGYNVHGELTDLDYTVGSVPYYHEHLVRDDLGRITHIDETVAGTSTSRTYGYDTAGRLASVTEAGNAGANRGWEYDAGQPGNGNRTLATYGPGVPPDSAYYDAQDRLLRYGNDTFGAAYDWTAAGELSQRNRPNQRLTTTYDALGNLTAASLKPLVNGSEQAGGSTTTTVAYRIDGQNRRVERVVSSPSGVTTQRWLYRDGLAPVAELDGTNAVVNRYVYGTQDHAPDLVVRSDGTYRVISDHLGSIRALVNIATGAVAQRIDYDAWGNESQNTAPALQSLGYAGGLTDAETKLVRFGARDYDPGVGRWTAKDPIGFAAGNGNLYGYVSESPIRFSDPSGERPLSAYERCMLSPYFDKGTLDVVDVSEGGGVPKDADAITLGRFVRFRPGTLSDDAEGLELLAHELVHIQQQRRMGGVKFYEWYVIAWLAGLTSGEKPKQSYYNNPFEQEAYARAAAISGMMRASGRDHRGCSECDQLRGR